MVNTLYAHGRYGVIAALPDHTLSRFSDYVTDTRHIKHLIMDETPAGTLVSPSTGNLTEDTALVGRLAKRDFAAHATVLRSPGVLLQANRAESFKRLLDCLEKDGALFAENKDEILSQGLHLLQMGPRDHAGFVMRHKETCDAASSRLALP